MARDEFRHWPTLAKRRQAARRGDLAWSRTLMLTVGVLALSGALSLLGAGGWQRSAQMLRGLWQTPAISLAGDSHSPRWEACWPVVQWAALLLAGVWLAVVVCGLCQTRGGWWPQRIAPDASRCLQGARQLCTIGALGDGLWRGLQAAILIAAGLASLWLDRQSLGIVAEAEARELPGLAGALLMQAFWRLAIALAVLASADCAWQAWRRHYRLRMSDRELQEELRQRRR